MKQIRTTALAHWIWLVVAATVGLFVLRSDPVRHAILVNLSSIQINQALAGNVPFVPSLGLAELAQRDDEQSLRLAVISQCVRDDFATAEVLLQRYTAIASPQQIDRMRFWITNWSLQLAGRGEETQADRIMRLQFVLGDDAMAYARMSQLYQSLGHTDRAEQFLAQSLALQSNAGTLMQLGSFYTEQGESLIQTDYHEAMRLLTLASRAFESAAQLDPAVFVYANYRLGDVYWKLNKRQDAVHAYRQAAESDETGHYAFLSWYYLGQIYSAWWNGGLDYELACGYFERALSIAATKREEAMSLSGIAAAYAAQGRKSEALAAYQRALRSDPTYEPAQRALDNLENDQ